MSQNSLIVVNGSGSSVRSELNNALDSLATTNIGNTRPSVIQAGQPWINNNTPSSSVWSLYYYDGTHDIKLGELDSSAGNFMPFVNGVNIDTHGPRLITEATLASASTTDLGSVTSNVIDITGTTTITAFGSSANTAIPIYFLRFTGILTLTYNASSLILPTAANITTATGDTAIAKYEGSGNWRVINYARANGQPLLFSSTVAYSSIAGCIISSIAGTHTTASFSVSTGQAADSTNAAYITSAGYSWLASNGNAINGTDAGSSTLANSTTYHIFLCSGGSGTGTFVSASLTPTLPTGYATYKRRIGSFNTDSSGNPIPLNTQIEIGGGAVINYLTTQTLDINVSNLGGTQTAYTLNVPTGIKVGVLYRAVTNTGSSGILLFSGDETNVAPGSFDWTTAPGADVEITGGGGSPPTRDGNLTTNTSGQILARGSGSSQTLYFVTRGWIDFRRS
jgi:hypothetical protein